MAVCPKCARENNLGSVFCRSCGSKLDLGGVTSEQFARARRLRALKRGARLFLFVPVVWVAVSLGLAFWPESDSQGKAGTPVGGQRAARLFASLDQAGRGQTLAVWLAEEDVNGFFRYGAAERMAADTLSVRFADGYLVARDVRVHGPFGLGPVEFAPRTSVDVVCTALGGRLRVVKARIGHFSAWGPFRAVAARRVSGLFDDWPEREAFARLSAIRIEPGRSELTVIR